VLEGGALGHSATVRWHTPPRGPYIIAMRTNFSVFRERLAEACQMRNMTGSNLCSGIGIIMHQQISTGTALPICIMALMM
jgi:hypothetical protein